MRLLETAGSWRPQLSPGWWVLLLICLSPFPPPAQADEPYLIAPDRAHVGQVFQVRVVAPGGPVSIRLSFMGKSLILPGEPVRDWSVVSILLGTDVKYIKAGTYPITAEITGPGTHRTIKRLVSLYAKDYPAQHLKVARKMVNPPPETQARIQKEAILVKKTLNTISEEQIWSWPFQRPVPGRVLSIYGLKRFFNGQPRAPHRGVDFRAPQGAPIKAVNKGRVILVGDHYFAGRSIYLDHGRGLVSAYFHLSEPLVQMEETVAAGQEIGLVGATGRVTGPHLHFGLYVLGQSVDPMPLFNGKLGPESGF